MAELTDHVAALTGQPASDALLSIRTLLNEVEDLRGLKHRVTDLHAELKRGSSDGMVRREAITARLAEALGEPPEAAP